MERNRDEVAIALRLVARSIKADVAPGNDAIGGTVDSLTEAGMGITAGLVRVADALDSIAQALGSIAEAIAESKQ